MEGSWNFIGKQKSCQRTMPFRAYTKINLLIILRLLILNFHVSH